MAVAVANTTQYLFKRNFNENKWAAVGKRECRIQVAEKSGEFYFKINDGNEKTEHRLARDSRLHLTSGFVQVPIAETKALYGIKFNSNNDAEVFYGRVIEKMGQSWCDQRTGVDEDNLPKPYSLFDQRPSIPATPPTSSILPQPRGEVPQPRGEVPQPRGEVPPVGYAPSPGPRQPPAQPDPVRRERPAQPLRAGGDEGGGYVSAGGRPGGPDSSMYHQPGGGGYGSSPRGGYEDRGFGVPERSFDGGANRDYRRAGGYGESGEYDRGERGRNMYDGRYDGGEHQRGREESFHRGGGFGGGGHPPHQQQQQQPPRGEGGYPRRAAWESNNLSNPGQIPRQPPAPRPPLPFKKTDLPSLVDSLRNAINKRDKAQSIEMLKAFLSVDVKPVGKVDMRLQDDEPAPTEKENTFVLHIGVEFQQPEKKPLFIFLDEVNETDTLDVLKTMVQVKFFIPKASQNWIVGNNLVTANDVQKTLKDLGVCGQFTSDVKVFMYVMHPKKANVPKEDFEGIRAKQVQQRKQQQPPELFGQSSVPDGNFTQPVRGYPASQADPIGNPIYNTLGSRGYTGEAPYAGGKPPPRTLDPQQLQYAQGAGDPVYSHISMRDIGPGGRGDLVTRAPPPNPAFTEMGRGPVYTRAPVSMQSSVTMSRNNPPRERDYNTFQPPGVVPSLGPAPREPPKPVKEAVGWSCAKCTMFNPPLRPSCEMCLNDRPREYQVPVDAPVDEATRKALESEKMFEEFQTKEKEREAVQAEQNYRKYLDTDAGEAVTNTEEFECPVCYGPIPPGGGLVLRGCLHEFCKDCLNGSVVNSNDPEIKCPFDNGEYICGDVISQREIKAVLSEEELETLYRRGLRQAENAAANSFHCHTADCEGFCFYEDEVNEFNCPVCAKKNCILCKAIHEDMNCQEYQDDLQRRAVNDEAANQTRKMLDELVKNGEAMNCPQCKVIVQKKEGCDWIRCLMCKTELCWATKGPRWGPGGRSDTSGGCKCRIGGKKCHPDCHNCH